MTILERLGKVRGIEEIVNNFHEEPADPLKTDEYMSRFNIPRILRNQPTVLENRGSEGLYHSKIELLREGVRRAGDSGLKTWLQNDQNSFVDKLDLFEMIGPYTPAIVLDSDGNPTLDQSETPTTNEEIISTLISRYSFLKKVQSGKQKIGADTILAMITPILKIDARDMVDYIQSAPGAKEELIATAILATAVPIRRYINTQPEVLTNYMMKFAERKADLYELRLNQLKKEAEDKLKFINFGGSR